MGSRSGIEDGKVVFERREAVVLNKLGFLERLFPDTNSDDGLDRGDELGAFVAPILSLDDLLINRKEFVFLGALAGDADGPPAKFDGFLVGDLENADVGEAGDDHDLSIPELLGDLFVSILDHRSGLVLIEQGWWTVAHHSNFHFFHD